LAALVSEALVFLTGEDGAQVDLLPVVADPAAAGDDGAAVVEGVLELGEA
jgi:hypothetical protein